MVYNIEKMSYTGELVKEDFSKTVYTNNNTPTSSTIFSEDNPPTIHDVTLIQDDSNLYIASDGSVYTYKTTTASYNTYIPPTGNTIALHVGGNVVSIPNGVETKLTSWATPKTNTTVGAWKSSTGTFTCITPGYYSIQARLLYNNASWTLNSEANITIKKNNVTQNVSPNFSESSATKYFPTGVAYAIIYLTTGNTITIHTYQSSGSAKSTYNPEYNTLTIVKLS